MTVDGREVEFTEGFGDLHTQRLSRGPGRARLHHRRRAPVDGAGASAAHRRRRAAVGRRASAREGAVRIVSLIASSTEIVCALGKGDELVGRSHECDFPAWVKRLPSVTAPKFPTDGTSYEIDQRVKAIVQEGLAVYRVDAAALEALRPDVIITQSQCEVCAVSTKDVEAAVCQMVGVARRASSRSSPTRSTTSGATSRASPRRSASPSAGARSSAELQGRMDAVGVRARDGGDAPDGGVHRVGRAAHGRGQLDADAGRARGRRRTSSAWPASIRRG